MPRIVQKYGGTSVGDVERIKKVAERLKAARDEGNELVVVVSARAGVTNELIARAKALTPNPSDRELDLSVMLSRSAVSRARSGLATVTSSRG